MVQRAALPIPDPSSISGWSFRLGRPDEPRPGACDAVLDALTGVARPLMPQAPMLSSAAGPWDGFYLEHHRDQPVEHQELLLLQPSLFLQLTPGEGVEYGVNAGPRVARQPLPGDVSILPGMTAISGSARRSGDFLHLSISPRFWIHATSNTGAPGQVEIAARHAVHEPLLRATMSALHAEAQAGYPGGRRYGESLAGLLVAHLARHHAAARLLPGGGLTQANVRRVTDHVEAHLDGPLPLAEMAALVGLSPFHFARSFKCSTGLTPHQFVLRSRVDRARTLLLRERVSVADVAARVGFADQSHLSAHFKRAFGTTPGAFARQVRTG